MNLTQLWGKANVLAEYLPGGGKEARTVNLTCESESLTLPITPWRFSVQTSQNNKFIDILDSGEMLNFGNQKLKRLKMSCFFPNLDRHSNHKYIVGDRLNPGECIALIVKWKESKKPVRVIITESEINLMMAINEFNYQEKDGSRDVYFDLTFAEYRELNTPAANNEKAISDSGLKDRPSETVSQTTEQVNQAGSTVTKESQGTISELSGCCQSPIGSQEKMTNQGQSAVKGISKARDVLEASKAAYGDFKKLQNLKDVNTLLHVGLSNVRRSLNGQPLKV